MRPDRYPMLQAARAEAERRLQSAHQAARLAAYDDGSKRLVADATRALLDVQAALTTYEMWALDAYPRGDGGG